MRQVEGLESPLRYVNSSMRSLALGPIGLISSNDSSIRRFCQVSSSKAYRCIRVSPRIGKLRRFVLHIQYSASPYPSRRIIPFRFNALIHEPLPVRISREREMPVSALMGGGGGAAEGPERKRGEKSKSLPRRTGGVRAIQSVTRTFTIWIPLV